MRWSGRIFWLLAFGIRFLERAPSSRLHPRTLSGIGLGKSYPVTAAQLLPVCTGFLAPIHFLFSSSQRTRSTITHSRFPAQDKFTEPRYNARRGRNISKFHCHRRGPVH